MYLPSDIQHMIVEFIPCSEYLTVNRKWNTKIKSIQKKAANTIGTWYKKKMLKTRGESEHNYSSVQQMVRNYIIHYPDEFFIGYPEFTVFKLDLEDDLLSVLPSPINRKRSDVRDWMLNIPIDLEDWMFVGW